MEEFAVLFVVAYGAVSLADDVIKLIDTYGEKAKAETLKAYGEAADFVKEKAAA